MNCQRRNCSALNVLSSDVEIALVLLGVPSLGNTVGKKAFFKLITQTVCDMATVTIIYQ